MNKERQAEGQKKRITKLREQGLYHEPKIEEFICKHCGKKFSYDVDNKHLTKYLKNGYCSDKCYRESGQKRLDKFKFELSNLGYTGITDDNCESMYKQMLSERTKNTYDKWLASHKKKGEDFFQKRGLSSVKTKHKHFLLKNNIVTEEEYKKLTEKQRFELYREHFNEITKHGDIIRQGRIDKNGGLEGFKQSYVKGRVNAVIKYMDQYVDEDYIKSLNDEEYSELLSEWSHKYAYYCQNKTRNEETNLRFKKTHLINQCGLDKETVDKMTDKDVDIKYSEYLSSRRMALSITMGYGDGYAQTLKGFFTFTDGTLFFYRSSWELEVCKILDELLVEGIVKKVSYPPKLPYFFIDRWHSYFPDFLIEYEDGFISTIEVKPFKKKSEDKNVAKFKAARKVVKNFMILTENEIFSNEIRNILEKHLYVEN